MATKNAPASDAATQNGAPVDLPLFYQNPVMLDKSKHRTSGVATKNSNYTFAKNVNAVPVTLIELPQIMMAYPIVFTAGPLAFPAVLLGLRDGENLFVDSKGQWNDGSYIPAYIRRYPFIFADQPNGDQLTLCIDDTNDWLMNKGGERLFTDEGEMTPLTENALEFCKSYHAASQETLRFAKALQESGILVERNATIQVEGKDPFQLSGFRQVDEAKLRALPEETVIQWHRDGWMAMVYAHLLSTQNWQKLFDVLQKQK